MRLLAAVEPDQLKSAAVAVMVILAIFALVVVRVMQKVVLKLIVLAALVGGGVFVYMQRDDLDECQRQVRATPALQDASAPEDRCECEFVGIEVKVPGCAALPGRGSGG